MSIAPDPSPPTDEAPPVDSSPAKTLQPAHRPASASASAPPPGFAATRAALLVLGAAGLAVVARAATFYLQVDRIAFGLALVIGCGFAVGIGELSARVARVRRTSADLARLPRPATIDAIDAASPALRSVLRARLGGARVAVPTAGFASYLVGFLVMVGLLGTFLGLVEALRGTREALGASGDVDALRAALATPMLGLGRAFGISAAGLITSALLGLASVCARRTEIALGAAVHAYADDELGPLTVAARADDVAARQLACAERQLELAERQMSLLAAMAEQSAAAAASSSKATEAVLAATAAVRADVAAGIGGVGRAVEQALTPALERAVARASDVTRERLDAWTAQVEADAVARRTRDEELARRWAELAGESAERVGREGGRVLGELRGALGESLASLDARLAASVEELATRLAARSASTSDELECRLTELTGTVDAMVRALAGELDGTRARLDRTLEVTTEALEAHAARSLARDEAQGAAIAARTAQLTDAESRAFGQLAQHVEAVDAAVTDHLARVLEAHDVASRSATERARALEAADARQAARTEALLSELRAASEEIVGRTADVLAHQNARQEALEARWLAAHEASAARLVTLLGEHARGIDQGLASSRALVDDAAGLLRASGVEMGAVAEVFTAAVDRYRDASAASLHALAGVDDAVDRAGKKAAIELLTDYLDQTREVFDHSLEVQRELFAELRALRSRGQTTPPESTRVRA